MTPEAPREGAGGDAETEEGGTTGRDGADRPDAAMLAVGALVGLAGLLFLSEPFVGPVAVGGARIRPFVLSAGVLGAGFALGAVVFRRRGRRLVAAAHAVAAAGWLTLFLAASVGSPPLAFAGVVILVAGAFVVVART